MAINPKGGTPRKEKRDQQLTDGDCSIDGRLVTDGADDG